MWNPFKVEPAPPAFGKDKILPEHNASIFSRVVFGWISPLLSVGYTRPLKVDDLWTLPDERLTSTLTEELEISFYGRCPPEDRPVTIAHKIHNVNDRETDRATDAGDKSKKSPYDGSLTWALYRTFFFRFWAAGLLKLCGDGLRVTTPLVTKVLLSWLTESYYWHRATEEQRAALGIDAPKGVGYGIGVGFGIFIMQEASSLFTNHSLQIMMTMGLGVRSALVGNIFRKSLRLSGRARLEHSVGQITTMISADATRLDRFAMAIHILWLGPIEICVGIALLIVNLGYSALVGVAILVISIPMQGLMAAAMFKIRKSVVALTDRRVRLTTEILQGIRLLKIYSWEKFYAHRVGVYREEEINKLKKASLVRATLIALVTLVPILAAVLSFITYALTNHDLSVAVIFTCLQYFNIIRTPLLFFPMSLAFMADAMVALRRIQSFLVAEELATPYLIEGVHDNDQESTQSVLKAAAYAALSKSASNTDSDSHTVTNEKDDAEREKYAIRVHGSFTWETVGPPEEKMTKKARKAQAKKEKKDVKAAKKEAKRAPVLPMTVDDTEDPEKDVGSEEGKPEEAQPFALKDLHMRIPRGSFVAIVGRVGSGKSSILQALIGEMRKTEGQVIFGGSVAYVPQAPWIRNATLRENIFFGQPEDPQQLDAVIEACALTRDLEMLPHGDQTQIGEKGINLSGGQKARVSLARAAYSPSDIVLLDDPLSAVDAYVGKKILENCLLSGPLAKKTRVLVTHALHVVDRADYVYVVDEGMVKEEGTFTELMQRDGTFTRIMAEYGNSEREDEETAAEESGPGEKKVKAIEEKDDDDVLMQDEERNTGSVAWSTYRGYLQFAGGVIIGPMLLGLLILNQVAAVGNNLFLGFWTGETIPGFTQGRYIAVYAGLGAAQAVFSFIFSYSISLVALIASLRIFKASLGSVLASPVSFFDTNPVGRILSRLSKDQDTLDNDLPMTLIQFLTTLASVIGTIGLVFYTFPYLGIMFAPMLVIYWFVQRFYRKTSVETKRLDSLMRSALYGSYSESLTGLATIRAYGTQERCINDAEHGLDMENRAYYMTISIQRWLSLRLDLLGNTLVLGIALFAAGFRTTVAPSKIGVVLTYTLSVTQIFSEMVTQFAQNEQNMNAVERILVYTGLPSEGSPEQEDADVPASWPHAGTIKFDNVDLAYRPGLPLVLKGVNFEIKPGEKVGIIGRTGAGKSSLLQALFRVVELQGGKIEIDGVDIAKTHLETLRGRLALVPQDSTLFLGTLRENLDPQGIRTDAELFSVLQRAWLLPRDGTPDTAAESKFRLDASVGDEGANFSAGEKQLLALARALVKNSRIIVLDEATSSVDVETDAKVQRTIQTEFSESTLLCIAHRLNTVAYYDRILVMDAGAVREFGTVLGLYDQEDSVFRSLCEEAGLSRADIMRIRKEADATEVV
ncbi:multidrug resistance-associated ABC transporter [Cylindrobasidium torrendii FP15055 ss-10]|uniref:Multidrug resistance-associated ABC transporter n=1 Tax=Cylindrobasidium torrendii FP15055 ss-10 TaxID=1314674 RepID=A0A0D7BPZ7_9AGAR|nr:multidrug resistance-associated ABC transporter [Cylindrobasidium torrendii FP15055 ss-10]